MLKKISVGLAGFIFLFLVWEISAKMFHHLLFILPAPSEIFKTILSHHQRLLFHTLATLKEMMGGFFIALCLAFPLAWMMVLFKSTRAIVQPFFIIIQCLPMFTLAPIMVIWFGWSFIAIVIPTALMIFFPLTLNIYQGLRSTPQDLLEFFQANQASEWQTFFKLRLPYAVPHIFGGFRISAAIAGIGAVAGEWAGAQEGLGILMLESRRNTDLEITFSALFCLTCLSALFYSLVLYTEKVALPPRTKKNALRALSLVSLFFILTLSFGCQSPKASKKQPETLKNPVRLLLDWLPNPNHVPLYAGLEKGFFKEENIDLVIQKMHENGHGISYLTSNQADLLVNHMPGTFRAASRGARIKIIGSLIKEPLNAIIYSKDLQLTCIDDLNKCTLGYCVGGPDTAFLDSLLMDNHISILEKRNISTDLIPAMCTRKVDGIYGGFWNIESFQLKALGFDVDIFRLSDFNVPNYYEMIVIAQSDSPYSQPLFVEKFQKALQKSLNFSRQYPDEAFEIYLKYNPDKRVKTIQWEKMSWQATLSLLARDQSIDREMVEKFYLWLKDRKLLSHSFNIDQLIPSLE